MNLAESYEFTNRQFDRVNIIYLIMQQQVYPLIAREMDSRQNLHEWDREPTFLGLFLRALTWVKSVIKLDEPTDLQPILTSVRTLLETSVDLQLLRSEPGNPCWKMYHWEESAKLKAALAQRSYYQRALPKKGKTFPLDIPDTATAVMQYIDNQEVIITSTRQALWPTHIDRNGNTKHPDRWTGSGNLLEDVRTADKVGGNLIKTILGMPLEEFYESEYRRLSWNVHGSGLAVVRHLTPSGVNSTCAFGYLCCTRLALLCTKLVIDEFGIAGELQLVQEAIDRLDAQTNAKTANNSGTSRA